MKSARPSADSSAVKFEELYVRPNPGRTLIVGSRVYADKDDRRKLYEDAVGVDMLEGSGVDIVADMEGDIGMPGGELGLFDHVECMSVLEHSKRPWLIAANIERLMKPGATIFVTIPFCWRVHGYPSDYWRMTPEAFKVIFPSVEWEHLMFASATLKLGPKFETIKLAGHPYFARTETVGFGRLHA